MHYSTCYCQGGSCCYCCWFFPVNDCMSLQDGMVFSFPQCFCNLTVPGYTNRRACWQPEESRWISCFFFKKRKKRMWQYATVHRCFWMKCDRRSPVRRAKQVYFSWLIKVPCKYLVGANHSNPTNEETTQSLSSNAVVSAVILYYPVKFWLILCCNRKETKYCIFWSWPIVIITITRLTSVSTIPHVGLLILCAIVHFKKQELHFSDSSSLCKYLGTKG